MYPVDKPTLNAAVATLSLLQPAQSGELLQQLGDRELLHRNISGNYFLPLEHCLQLFPENITKPAYQQMLQQVPANDFHFYSAHAALQEVQRLLVAAFIGDKSLLFLPIRKIEQQLNEYLPFLSCLAGRQKYRFLLQLFDSTAVEAMFAWAMRFQLQQLQPLALIRQLKQELQQFSSNDIVPETAILEGSLTLLPQPATADDYFANAIYHLYHMDTAQAKSSFELGIKKQRSADKKNIIPTTPLMAFYYASMLVLLPVGEATPQMQKVTEFYERKHFPAIIPAIALLQLHMGKREKAENLLQLIFEMAAKEPDKRLMLLLGMWALKWYHPKNKLLLLHQATCRLLLAKAIANGYTMPALEYLYYTRDEGYEGYESWYREMIANTGLEPLGTRSLQVPEWERILNALLGTEEKKKEKAGSKFRIAWLVDLGRFTVQPVQQQYKEATGWSRGRNIALSRIKDGSAEGMTEQDIRIGSTVQRVSFYNAGADSWSFEQRVWQEIAGHPLLFSEEDGETPVEVIKATPELSVLTHAKGFTFKTNIDDYSSPVIFVRESLTRLKVIPVSAQQQHLLRTLQQLQSIPASGKDKLAKVLQHLSAYFTIHADILDTPADIRSIRGDARIVVQLLPMNTGLKAAFFIKPFKTDPPYCKPGLGGKSVLGIMNGERCQALRDQEQEMANFNKLLGYIQQNMLQEVDDDQIIFEDPADCLQLLEIIREHPDLAIAEWPEGERYRISKQVDLKDLHIAIKEKDHWFTCEANIYIDEYTVLSLKELLDDKAVKKHKFVTLKNGEIISLEDNLRKRIYDLAAFIIEEDNSLRIRPMLAPFAAEALLDMEKVETDRHWKSMLAKWQKAQSIQPEVPAGLQTSLRNYQEEGFRWMVQLASWGAGACLADDMGLGKTVQSLALLLQRAAEGPALIVCPASVLPNWISEALRFAPALQFTDLSSGNRAAIIKKAAAFEVVITTYGLLQSEEQLLANRKWATIVLDEAHIIRNHQTRTAKAAYNLQAGFKLALTGTPIQNNLTEIWGLFRFLCPELLGSIDFFNKQYVFPSLRNPESNVKKQLKRILSPFMLRRTKTAVLEELPPSTEIVKLVEQSPEETALYEAVRRRALESLTAQEGNNAQRHIRALAEITRLRMAACHPKLVDSQLEMGSSKLNAFLEIVDELLENNHKALVFSQFVKHLDLVKAALLQKGIRFLYLDGSTPIATRAKLVKQFQAGEADLFLISLKAGGLGLNLTAADYVIHLDPWWNPAIEEQASDRARRIGQTRPVTIYRLVAMHTIEEKILTLHNTKRELADQLLEGTDMAVKLSADELIELVNTL
ncbi:DEAD/DEAH box helicase [Chitinophaga sp. Cy-1792]|uniref:DEAD/DEAH box helicase n=1 Tax=Chitinophaga sp. Cy-1792 TaxID=2608339 RepID=UPI0014212436|nr:DEAD/DEAH box helicase [Chitinophaga sp. Cy-1792]NIG54811.1 DEAD/DEAH box helicase [Chitinophaga sp. Cy-1792]